MKKLAIALLALVVACTTVQDQPSQDTAVDQSTTTTTTTTVPQTPKEGLEVGDIAPDVQLTTMDGEKKNLSDYRGQVVLLNLWATWCPYCREEMAIMQDMHDKYEDSGLAVLAVDVGEERGVVQQLLDELNLTFPAFLDRDRNAYEVYNKINALPQTYIIDADGIIRGYVPGSFASIARAQELEDLIVEFLSVKND